MPLYKVCARGSRLSRIQVEEVYQELLKQMPDLEFETHFVDTMGDKNKTISLMEMEKTDFFTRELDEMILNGTCDLAIHSAKDLPDPLPPGLALIYLSQGKDPQNSLVFNRELHAGARIGTSSKARVEQIESLYPEAKCVDIRGTIEERLAKLDSGEYDALVMAECALLRLGIDRKRIALPGYHPPLQGKLAVIAKEGFTWNLITKR